MADHAYDDLVRDLTALGRTIDAPAPSGDLTTTVMERVATPPRPSEPAAWWSRRRHQVAVAVAAALLALLATPPVRAAVADWFGFGGVRVERNDSDFGPPGPPPGVSGVGSVAAAAESVGFPVSVPEEPGEPDGVGVSADRRMVSMSWTTDAGVLRLDQFDGRIDYYAVKQAPDVEFVMVNGGDGLWFDEPHEVALLDADGSEVTHSARLAGQTLIWQDGATTLRLEGDVDLGRAVEIAESAVRVD
jgi:hypothetical protein